MSSFPKNKELRKGRDPGIPKPSVSEFEDPNFLQFHMAQKTMEKLRTTTNSAMLAVGGGLSLKISKYPKESHQKWHAKEGFLLMATRNRAFTHQLRLVVYPIIYRVLAPSQVVGLGISGCHQQFLSATSQRDQAKRPLHRDCFCWSKRCRL